MRWDKPVFGFAAGLAALLASGCWMPATEMTSLDLRASRFTNDHLQVDDIMVAAFDTATLFAGAIPDVTTLGNAQTSIDSIDTALAAIAPERAAIGASINQLTASADNLGTAVQNVAAAKSQILDADVANESGAFAKRQVLMQAGVSMLAQANAVANLSLRLIG